jgi:hypothetical protein
MAKIKAYNVRTKKKGCVMFDAVISRTAYGVFMAQGNDGEGGKLTALVSQQTAKDAVASGDATLSPGTKFD